jgi:O-antigen/teichoic acid export membrane protein
MLGLAAIAKPLILVLIGEKWSGCHIPANHLLFSHALPPTCHQFEHLQVKGRSDLFLKLKIIET